MGVGMSLSAACLGGGLWWLSFGMQLSGLFLSAGALIVVAIDQRVPSVWQALTQWFRGFASLFRDPPANDISFNGALPGLDCWAFGGADFPPNIKTSEEKVICLLKVINEQHQTVVGEFRKLEGKDSGLGERLRDSESKAEEHRIDVIGRIREISVGSFYQVVLGVFLLSTGSISSLFLSPC